LGVPEYLEYLQKSRDLNNRLVGEFKRALDEMQEQHRESDCKPCSVKVLPFPQQKNQPP
jgi:hypothetical protein